MPKNENKHVDDIISERVKSGIEFRMTQPIEIRADDGEGKKIVKGYATTFNEPYLLYEFEDYRVFEVIDPHAFDGCDMSDVIMQYDHQGRVFARTRNKTLELSVDKHGLDIEADLAGTELGNQVYEEIKGGYTDRMSIAFRVKEDKREIVRDSETNITTVTRTITKFSKLYDVSAVSIPANDGTEISARSLSEGILEETRKEALEAERRARKAKAIAIAIKIIRKDQ